MVYRILAVDDHPETLDIVVATLRNEGYHVIGTRSPIKALSLVGQIRPHLVLLDMSMPEMDGIEVCRRIRAHPEMGNVPIIMFTAENQVHQKVAGFEAGVDDYLTKPTEPDELVNRIESMLAGSKGATAVAPSAPQIQIPDDWVTQTPSSATTVTLPTKESLIAVLGARGGAGTTTIAINLALAVAQQKQPTSLIDLDQVQGHIALYLNQTILTNGLQALSDQAPQTLKQHLGRQISHYNEHLDLLLSRPNLDGWQSSLSALHVTALLDTLVKPGRCIIADLGRGISEATRPVLDRADQIIVCLRPERVSLAAAKILLGHLKETLFPHTTLSVMVFNIGSNLNLPQDAIQSYLEHALLGVITVDFKQMARASNKGMPLVQLVPDDPASMTFLSLAQQLVRT